MGYDTAHVLVTSSCALTHAIYIGGGLDISDTGFDDLWKYTIASNEWALMNSVGDGYPCLAPVYPDHIGNVAAATAAGTCAMHSAI